LLVGLALLAEAADGDWQPVWRETFDDWPLGRVPAASHDWQALPDGNNRVEVMAVEKGRAVRLLDVVHAPKNTASPTEPCCAKAKPKP
jgi:hypothetical protein